MAIRDEALPDWAFHVEEVSAGVYSVIATDRAGRTVEKKGIDPEALIMECKQAAIEMIQDEAERPSR